MKNFLFAVLSLILIAFITYIIPKDAVDLSEKKNKPNDWFFEQRAYPNGQINHAAYIQSLKIADQNRSQQKIKDDSTQWEFAGPTNIGGRLTDVEMHPSNLETIYIGAASGGVFKTEDTGETWEAIFDEALSLSIGDIAIAPGNPDILYVGTGEANAGGGSLAYDGIGIYKSTNGGESWEHKGLEESRNIGRMVVHPTNPDIVYVAAMGNLFAENPDRGVFKSNDGGDTWENVLYISDSTGGIDIVIHPENPDTLYAAMWERIRRPNRRSYGGSSCGLYRTFDGGNNWEELINGIPSTGDDIGRIGLDISRSDPSILYTIYSDKTGYFDGVYKTMNNGDSWTQTNDGALETCYQSYGWWFGRISVDPVDPDNVYIIGFDLYKTSNGGNSWFNISEYEAHVDQHGLYTHPQNNDFVVLGNDGGLYISQDGGNNWDWINNLPITQFYTCEVDYQFPERLYGGTQDNGTNRTLTGNTDDWENIYGGDGFYVLVDPEDNNYIYAEYQYGNLVRSTNGGNSFNWAMSGINSADRKNWNTPVVFDPTNPEVLYYGSNKLYKSENRASSWSAISTDLTNGPGINLTYGTITTIGVSLVNPEIIYVGTDDGNLWVSAMNGMGWELLSAELPDQWVTRVVADPLDEETAYVTFSGYRWDEFVPHIFRTTNKGASWEDISGNLPETPINDLVIDPEDNNIIYIATDVGVYCSKDIGLSWEMLGWNLPNVVVNDLKLHNPTRKLIAATFGRSMYTYDLFQDTLSTSTIEPELLNINTMVSCAPNPFSKSVKITIKCQSSSNGILEIYNLSGQNVKTLYKGKFEKGINSFTWQPMKNVNLKEGIYFLKLNMEGKSITKKIIYQID